MRGFAVAAVLAAGLGLMSSVRTEAEVRDPGHTGAYIDDAGDPTAEATDTVASGSGGGGSGSPSPCHWEVAVADDFAFAVYSADSGTKQHSATGRWLQKVCDGLGVVDVDGSYLVPEGGLVDPEALAVRAVRSVKVAGPTIATSPARSKGLVVQVPTWLWIGGDWWRPYEATASAGRVQSTVSVRPVHARWILGDGTSIDCHGPGRAWKAGLPDSLSDCQHTYRRSSAGEPGGTIALHVEVTLAVTWSSNVGGGGALADITRTSSVDVEVGEIQAIGTR